MNDNIGNVSLYCADVVCINYHRKNDNEIDTMLISGQEKVFCAKDLDAFYSNTTVTLEWRGRSCTVRNARI